MYLCYDRYQHVCMLWQVLACIYAVVGISVYLCCGRYYHVSMHVAMLWQVLVCIYACIYAVVGISMYLCVYLCCGRY